MGDRASSLAFPHAGKGGEWDQGTYWPSIRFPWRVDKDAPISQSTSGKWLYHCCRGGWLPGWGWGSWGLMVLVFPQRTGKQLWIDLIRIICLKLDKLAWFLPSVYVFCGHQCLRSIANPQRYAFWFWPRLMESAWQTGKVPCLNWGSSQRFRKFTLFCTNKCRWRMQAHCSLKSVRFHPGPLNGINSFPKMGLSAIRILTSYPKRFCTQYPQNNIRSV